MQERIALKNQKIKWPEIYSLALLNAAVVISWIAYHEYQPVLIEKFSFESLVDLLIVSKAIILVIIPPIAGLVADAILKKNGKYFTVFAVGIGATAMIFMVVASIIQAGPVSMIRPALPVMIVLWLIAMNIFMSPANSMIDSFAPAKKLPVVVGFLFLITELLYALEPVIVELVNFFGDTLTFIVGGVLIGGSGFIFHKVSRDEVLLRKKEQIQTTQNSISPVTYLSIVVIGLLLGLGKAFIVEFFPHYMEIKFQDFPVNPSYIALALLAASAIFAYFLSLRMSDEHLNRNIYIGFGGIALGVILILVSGNSILYIAGGLITALCFGLLNISGMPFTFKHLNARHITYGIGVFIGASELFTGLFEYLLV